MHGEMGFGARVVGVVALVCVLCLPAAVSAQAAQSGLVDFSAAYYNSSAGRHGVGLGGRAMAIDRVSGTVVGRFGELRAGIGIDFEGEVLAYDFAFKLGVGLATDWFTLFLASGFFVDAYECIDDVALAETVPVGFGIPLTIGLWITPLDLLHLYSFFEPAWVIEVESRELPDFPVAEEYKVRGGIGLVLEELSFRLDYTYHAVAPVEWHQFSFGIGPKPPQLADL